MKKLVSVAVTLFALCGLAPAASAFCGFYVSGAGGALYNNATQVVLMRSGTKTVLSMQNSYKGPPANFAMVVPVPVVLQKENVKTLPKDVFERVDRLAAPRLVEYWEQDPCAPEPVYALGAVGGVRKPMMARQKSGRASDLGVTVEAKFDVGEYQVVILSAKDAAGLETWLRQEQYKIPDGAEPYLRPYVEGGSKFFVAKVDTKKVKFENGLAMLSPLRFHYDSQEFSLPVRLGMMNSEGTQDLIVHILAENQRYEVANHPNATIPTNLTVTNDSRERFGELYAAIFDATVAAHPRAVITEYAWGAGSCDPCPTPPLAWNDLATLGYDVIRPGQSDSQKVAPSRGRGGFPAPPGNSFVLTRLHARYGKDALGEDLVFRAAPPIVGGREFLGNGGKLEEGSVPGGFNNFQARYAIRHEWQGKIACENPVRGRWGGPPSGQSSKLEAATDLAFVPRGNVTLGKMVKGGLPALALPARAEVPREPETAPPTGPEPKAEPAPVAPVAPETQTSKNNKGCAQAGAASWAGGFLALLALSAMIRRRRRHS